MGRIIYASGVKLSDPKGDRCNPYDSGSDNKIPPPIVNKKHGIGINGIGDDGHEPFSISCKGYASMGFTKTARKPYDDVVTCVLLRAYMLEPDVVRVSYTHYYRINTRHREWKKIWPQFVIDVRRIIHASGVDVTDPDGMNFTLTKTTTATMPARSRPLSSASSAEWESTEFDVTVTSRSLFPVILTRILVFARLCTNPTTTLSLVSC
ncbi:hypothetical protein SI65_01057 [Aspergillus cristatus]|uniref:Uncharacterized protein n=1 Tax=Aspergillus cristatus TaxID=573508 RepID=A0A1E3BRA0_ASPCR|nr:hypothetical protein SI65_01057 [Aspergillus cristatus]